MKQVDLFETLKLTDDMAENACLELDLGSQKTADTFLLDYEKLSAFVKKISIRIPAYSHSDITEINLKPNLEINYFLGANSEVNYGIAILGKETNFKAVFNLETGAHVRAGLADFSFAKGKVNYLFRLLGKKASAQWRLATLADGTDNDKEFHISFDHVVGDTYSMMENYGVCQNGGHLLFAGVSHIFPDADDSSAHQKAKIMVFDENCIAKANPILKIDDNEVEASHAAAVGKVNDEHLFYLTSRGISRSTAKYLITLGYLNPVLNAFSDDKLKAKIADYISSGVKA
ncbi:MAG TPA: SufD family Fe-S cluster assembly protein [Bacilli bacterium]|nr:SufD family Fe-S cluster assembly protein [Bacilli bacterium]